MHCPKLFFGFPAGGYFPGVIGMVGSFVPAQVQAVICLILVFAPCPAIALFIGVLVIAAITAVSFTVVTTAIAAVAAITLTTVSAVTAVLVNCWNEKLDVIVIENKPSEFSKLAKRVNKMREVT